MFAYKLSCFLLINSAFAAQLPSFIDKCSRSSPKLQQCVTRQLPNVIEELRKGDEDLGLISLEPLEIPRIDFNFDVDEDFTLSAKNVHMEGLTDVVTNTVFVDPNDDRLEISAFFPHIYISTDYIAKGIIEGVEIDTIGPAELHFANVTVDLKIRFYKFVVDGMEFYKVPGMENFKVKLKIGRHGVRILNLVKYDVAMTEYLNEKINYNLNFEGTKEKVAIIIRGVTKKVLEPFLSQVPIQNFFNE